MRASPQRSYAHVSSRYILKVQCLKFVGGNMGTGSSQYYYESLVDYPAQWIQGRFPMPGIYQQYGYLNMTSAVDMPVLMEEVLQGTIPKWRAPGNLQMLWEGDSVFNRVEPLIRLSSSYGQLKTIYIWGIFNGLRYIIYNPIYNLKRCHFEFVGARQTYGELEEKEGGMEMMQI